MDMKREKNGQSNTGGPPSGCLPFFAVIAVITVIIIFGKDGFKKDFNYLMRGEADFKSFFTEIKEAYEKNMTYPDFIMPMEGNITSGFGMRKHPVTNEDSMHTGIDIDINAGSTVRASQDGEIIKQGTDESFGNYIIIKHKGQFSTCYAHLESFKKAEGEYVKKGDEIGEAGSTGQVTGPHLHFEIRKGEERVDPLKYLIRDETNENTN